MMVTSSVKCSALTANVSPLFKNSNQTFSYISKSRSSCSLAVSEGVVGVEDSEEVSSFQKRSTGRQVQRQLETHSVFGAKIEIESTRDGLKTLWASWCQLVKAEPYER